MSILSSTSSGKAKIDKEYIKFGLKPDKVTYNSDGTIDYDGCVYINSLMLKKIPFRFSKVTGSFYCGDNQLTNLEGAPRYVGGDFNCAINTLTSLKGGPEIVGGDFNCKYCGYLGTLKGAPREVSFILCDGCGIKSLKPLNKSKIRGIRCQHNSLKSLKGCPESLKELQCDYNLLTTLEGCPKSLEYLNVEYNYLTEDSFNDCGIHVSKALRCLAQCTTIIDADRMSEELAFELDVKKVMNAVKAKHIY